MFLYGGSGHLHSPSSGHGKFEHSLHASTSRTISATLSMSALSFISVQHQSMESRESTGPQRMSSLSSAKAISAAFPPALVTNGEHGTAEDVFPVQRESDLGGFPAGARDELVEELALMHPRRARGGELFGEIMRVRRRSLGDRPKTRRPDEGEVDRGGQSAMRLI